MIIRADIAPVISVIVSTPGEVKFKISVIIMGREIMNESNIYFLYLFWSAKASTIELNNIVIS